MKAAAGRHARSEAEELREWEAPFEDVGGERPIIDGIERRESDRGHRDAPVNQLGVGRQASAPHLVPHRPEFDLLVL